jgi:tripartite-type tricarboxylate transporter receptor subunit TctC
MSKSMLVHALFVLALSMPSTLGIAAEIWPARPLRLVVPFPPGGSSDIAARAVSHRLAERLEQQVVVDNRGSAGGIVGAEVAARAAPDGYTFVLSNVTPFTVSPVIFSNVGYDPVKSFTHVAFIGTTPVVLAVHPDYAARSVADVVKMAKAAPGKLDFGSAGNGTVGHIVGEMFKAMTGAHINHVPFRASAQVFIDLRAKRIPLSFDALAQNMDRISAGLVRPLAVSSRQRVALAPDIPTFVELGYPNLVGENWLGISGPAGLPRPVVQRLHREMIALAKEPEIAERLKSLSITHQPFSPEEFTKYVASEYARWRPILISAGVKVN